MPALCSFLSACGKGSFYGGCIQEYSYSDSLLRTNHVVSDEEEWKATQLLVLFFFLSLSRFAQNVA